MCTFLENPKESGLTAQTWGLESRFMPFWMVNSSKLMLLLEPMESAPKAWLAGPRASWRGAIKTCVCG